MNRLAHTQQPNITVVSLGEGKIVVRSDGWEHEIVLAFSHHPGNLVLVQIPQSYVSLLTANNRFERLKQLLQMHFKGAKIETRTGPPLEWRRAEENRARTEQRINAPRPRSFSRTK